MNALRFLTAALVTLALVLAVGSFAPIALSDFARMGIRVAAFAALSFGYVAYEARNLLTVR